MRVTIKLHAGDYEQHITDVMCADEGVLKKEFPQLHEAMENTWRWVAPDEREAIYYGDLAMDWMGQCSDNCHVEPDGRCPHGFYSLGIRLGLI